MRACFATDMIVVDGYPLIFMCRETPHREEDSGWRFMSGFEDDEYMNNAETHGVYALNTLANYDPDIMPFIDYPVGSVFEKIEDQEQFVTVADWLPSESWLYSMQEMSYSAKSHMKYN